MRLEYAKIRVTESKASWPGEINFQGSSYLKIIPVAMGRVLSYQDSTETKLRQTV